MKKGHMRTTRTTRTTCAALLSVLCLLLMASAAVAQPVCRTIVLPDQGSGFKTYVNVPARSFAGIYPVFFQAQPGTTVGLEFWAHRVRGAGLGAYDPPQNYVVINGYIVNTITNEQNVIMPQSNLGPAQDNVWRVFPMSTFLHVGEYFTVGLYNTSDGVVTVDLAITIRECLVP
jgi:hypothetical protein